MYYLKHIITTAALLTAINVNAELVVPDAAVTAGPKADNANPNANGGVARFKKGQVVVKGVPSDFPDYTVIKVLPHAGLVVLEAEPGKELAEIRKLKGENKKASLNFIAQQFTTVSDTYFYPYQWNFSAVQAEDAWDISTGAGVKVAVLDTGLQLGGSDGIGCVSPGIDIVNGDNNPSDGNGHGTHVSGTIAQKTNNYGTAGLAHGACIQPVKVLSDAGSGTDADIAEGIAWAVANGARVINMSLGYPAGYPLSMFVGSASYNALNAASNQVTIVVASGNDGSTTGISYPASHPETIAVGATGYSDAYSYPTIAPYSNQGPALDIVAPGGDMSVDLNGDGYGDGILQETVGSVGWAHYFFQGTSMATPHVAAAAAMLIAQDDSLNRYEVLNKLSATALDVGAAGKDNTYGHGLIQVYDALMLAPPVVNQAPNAAFNYSCFDLVCDFTSTSSDSEDTTVSSTAWDFGDNSFAASTTVQHEFAAAGSYDVILTVADSEGLEGTTVQTVTVTSPPVNQAPVASFSSSCVNLDCSFTSTSTDSDGEISGYVWDINGVVNNSNQAAINHVFAGTGNYLVTLTVTDNNGAQASVAKTVYVTAPNVLPLAAFSYSCIDYICTFNSTSTDPDGTLTALEWNFGDNSAISTTNQITEQQKVYSVNGSYVVSLTVTDNNGAKVTAHDTVNINVIDPVVEFLAPSSATVSDNADGTATVAWSDGNSNGSTTGFEIQRRKWNSRKGIWGSWSTITSTPSSITTVIDASGKGIFQYQVRALGNSEISGWTLSNEQEVTSVTTKSGGGTKGGRKTR